MEPWSDATRTLFKMGTKTTFHEYKYEGDNVPIVPTPPTEKTKTCHKLFVLQFKKIIFVS